MVPSIVIHLEAVQDLEELWESEPHVAGTLEALFQQLKADPRKLATLSSQHFGEDKSAAYSVVRVVSQWFKGRDIWRLKCWELERLGLQYRVIYGINAAIERHYILGIIHRDYAYDHSHPRVQRMVRAYDRLKIPDPRGS